MKKTFAILMALLMALSVLSACADTSTTPAESTQPAQSQEAQQEDTEQEPVTITFWDGNWSEPFFEQIIPIWNEENPNITIEAEFFAGDSISNQYLLALENGTSADVMSCALDWTTTYGNAGFLAPLDEFIAADGVDTAQFVQGAINASTVDGSLYALPFRSETFGLFYNVDMLEAAGYTQAPQTWDEVLEIAEACTTDDVAGYGLVGADFGNYSFQYITMMRTSGSDILDENGQSALGTDLAIETAQLYKDLSAFAPASLLENNNAANRTLFASGKVAMYISGIYDAPEIIKANPELNFGCALVPTANDAERSTILGGWSVGISESSENKEAAWKFIEFLTRPDVAAIYTNTFTGTMAPSTSLDGIAEEIVQPHADALAYANALPSVANIVGIRQAIFDNLSLTLSDSATVEEAIASLDAEVTELLAE